MNVRGENNYRNTSLFIIAVIIGCLNGCGYTEGVIQKSERSYLWFTGNTENAIVYVDNKEFARLISPGYGNEGTAAKNQNNGPVYYQLEPGKHEIRIERNGQVIVNRTLLLGGQMTREVEIP